MDGCATETALAAASILVPMAMRVGKNCFSRVREPTKCQKSVLVVPHRSGKGFLHNALLHQHQILVVDVDEDIKGVSTDKEYEKLRSSPIDSIAYEMDYDELADRVLEATKKRLKHNKGLRVLFLTSSLTWAKTFKKDALYVASPDAEFWAKILETESDAHEKDLLRRARERFLNSVDKRVVQTYSTFQQLVDAVKGRMSINAEL